MKRLMKGYRPESREHEAARKHKSIKHSEVAPHVNSVLKVCKSLSGH